MITHSPAPTNPNPLPQATSAAEAPTLAESASPTAASPASQCQLQHEVADLRRQVQAQQHTISQLRQQLMATTATTTRLEDRLAASELQLRELRAAEARTSELADSVGMLFSRQQQLQQRQQLDECQRSVVLKCPEPLPADGAAQHLQQLLRKQLQLTVTVQAVRPLGGKQHDSDGNGGGASRAASKHAYKVVLGSSGQRTEVMRVKAQRLRGTPLSIDELLTPDQLASRQRLQPVARQAAAAGQRVRWRHGSLLIDGKPYTGPGSLPTPGTAAAAAKGGSNSQHQPAAAQVADGWQTVQRRSKKGKRPAAAGSKKALFSSPNGKQHQRSSGAKKAGSGSMLQPTGTGAVQHKPKPSSGGGSSSATKPKPSSGGVSDGAAKPKPSSGGGSSGAAKSKPSSGSGSGSGSATVASSGNGKQQQPAGGAGGALADVASLGEGLGDTSAPTAQPAAGHGVSPPNAESPPAAAVSNSQEQPATAGTAGGEQPPAMAAGDAAPASSPSARA